MREYFGHYHRQNNFRPILIDAALYLFECNPHLESSVPDDTTRQLQTILLDNQVEKFFEGKDSHQIRKLDRGSRCRNIAHYAWIFVAAVLSDGSFVHSEAWGNSSFHHENDSKLTSFLYQREVLTHQFVRFRWLTGFQ